MTKAAKLGITLFLIGVFSIGAIQLASLRGNKPPAKPSAGEKASRLENLQQQMQRLLAEGKPADEVVDELEKAWKEMSREAIAKHELLIGMKEQQVRASWGRPMRIIPLRQSRNWTEKWIYGHAPRIAQLYFYGGVLDRAETFDGERSAVFESTTASRFRSIRQLEN